MTNAKRPQGKAVPPEIRVRGLQMAKDKCSTQEICQTLGVTHSTVRRWRRVVGVKTPPRQKQDKAGRKAGRKNGALSPMNYLADQLAEMTNLIRTALPNLTRFTLTTTPDGKAHVEYTVRQLSEINGQVTL